MLQTPARPLIQCSGKNLQWHISMFEKSGNGHVEYQNMRRTYLYLGSLQHMLLFLPPNWLSPSQMTSVEVPKLWFKLKNDTLQNMPLNTPFKYKISDQVKHHLTRKPFQKENCILLKSKLNSTIITCTKLNI